MSDGVLLLFCMGFLGGALFATIFIGLLISHNQESPGSDRSIDSRISCGSRNRRSHYGHSK